MDEILAEAHGSFVKSLADRNQLSRTQAQLFFYAYFYRRLLLAAIVLTLYRYSVLQV